MNPTDYLPSSFSNLKNKFYRSNQEQKQQNKNTNRQFIPKSLPEDQLYQLINSEQSVYHKIFLPSIPTQAVKLLNNLLLGKWNYQTNKTSLNLKEFFLSLHKKLQAENLNKGSFKLSGGGLLYILDQCNFLNGCFDHDKLYQKVRPVQKSDEFNDFTLSYNINDTDPRILEILHESLSTIDSSCQLISNKDGLYHRATVKFTNKQGQDLNLVITCHLPPLNIVITDDKLQACVDTIFLEEKTEIKLTSNQEKWDSKARLIQNQILRKVTNMEIKPNEPIDWLKILTQYEKGFQTTPSIRLNLMEESFFQEFNQDKRAQKILKTIEDFVSHEGIKNSNSVLCLLFHICQSHYLSDEEKAFLWKNIEVPTSSIPNEHLLQIKSLITEDNISVNLVTALFKTCLWLTLFTKKENTHITINQESPTILASFKNFYMQFPFNPLNDLELLNKEFSQLNQIKQENLLSIYQKLIPKNRLESNKDSLFLMTTNDIEKLENIMSDFITSKSILLAHLGQYLHFVSILLNKNKKTNPRALLGLPRILQDKNISNVSFIDNVCDLIIEEKQRHIFNRLKFKSNNPHELILRLTNCLMFGDNVDHKNIAYKLFYIYLEKIPHENKMFISLLTKICNEIDHTSLEKTVRLLPYYCDIPFIPTQLKIKMLTKVIGWSFKHEWTPKNAILTTYLTKAIQNFINTEQHKPTPKLAVEQKRQISKSLCWVLEQQIFWWQLVEATTMTRALCDKGYINSKTIEFKLVAENLCRTLFKNPINGAHRCSQFLIYLKKKKIELNIINSKFLLSLYKELIKDPNPSIESNAYEILEHLLDDKTLSNEDKPKLQINYLEHFLQSNSKPTIRDSFHAAQTLHKFKGKRDQILVNYFRLIINKLSNQIRYNNEPEKHLIIIYNLLINKKTILIHKNSTDKFSFYLLNLIKFNTNSQETKIINIEKAFDLAIMTGFKIKSLKLQKKFFETLTNILINYNNCKKSKTLLINFIEKNSEKIIKRLLDNESFIPLLDYLSLMVTCNISISSELGLKITQLKEMPSETTGIINKLHNSNGIKNSKFTAELSQELIKYSLNIEDVNSVIHHWKIIYDNRTNKKDIEPELVVKVANILLENNKTFSAIKIIEDTDAYKLRNYPDLVTKLINQLIDKMKLRMATKWLIDSSHHLNIIQLIEKLFQVAIHNKKNNDSRLYNELIELFDQTDVPLNTWCLFFNHLKLINNKNLKLRAFNILKFNQFRFDNNLDALNECLCSLIISLKKSKDSTLYNLYTDSFVFKNLFIHQQNTPFEIFEILTTAFLNKVKKSDLKEEYVDNIFSILNKYRKSSAGNEHYLKKMILNFIHNSERLKNIYLLLRTFKIIENSRLIKSDFITKELISTVVNTKEFYKGSILDKIILFYKKQNYSSLTIPYYLSQLDHFNIDIATSIFIYNFISHRQKKLEINQQKIFENTINNIISTEDTKVLEYIMATLRHKNCQLAISDKKKSFLMTDTFCRLIDFCEKGPAQINKSGELEKLIDLFENIFPIIAINKTAHQDCVTHLMKALYKFLESHHNENEFKRLYKKASFYMTPPAFNFKQFDKNLNLIDCIKNWPDITRFYFYNSDISLDYLQSGKLTTKENQMIAVKIIQDNFVDKSYFLKSKNAGAMYISKLKSFIYAPNLNNEIRGFHLSSCAMLLDMLSQKKINDKYFSEFKSIHLKTLKLCFDTLNKGVVTNSNIREFIILSGLNILNICHEKRFISDLKYTLETIKLFNQLKQPPRIPKYIIKYLRSHIETGLRKNIFKNHTNYFKNIFSLFNDISLKIYQSNPQNINEVTKHSIHLLKLFMVLKTFEPKSIKQEFEKYLYLIECAKTKDYENYFTSMISIIGIMNKMKLVNTHDLESYKLTLYLDFKDSPLTQADKNNLAIKTIKMMLSKGSKQKISHVLRFLETNLIKLNLSHKQMCNITLLITNKIGKDLTILEKPNLTYFKLLLIVLMLNPWQNKKSYKILEILKILTPALTNAIKSDQSNDSNLYKEHLRFLYKLVTGHVANGILDDYLIEFIQLLKPVIHIGSAIDLKENQTTCTKDIIFIISALYNRKKRTDNDKTVFDQFMGSIPKKILEEIDKETQ